MDKIALTALVKLFIGIFFNKNNEMLNFRIFLVAQDNC